MAATGADNSQRHAQTKNQKRGEYVKEAKVIIAFRRKCKSSGTGLSHYILLEKKRK